MSKKKEKQVSIVGSSYFQPITDLIGRLLKHKYPGPNAVQSGYFENGYAVSIVLLLVAMLESYIVRLRYVHNSQVLLKIRNPIKVLLKLFPRFRLKKALTDVYVLRDSVFHNHLWEIEYSWHSSPPMIFKNATKSQAFGDSKYVDRVNLKTRRTKALNLHVVPTRVDRRDALKVFNTIWKTLIFLESKDRFQCYVSHIHVKFRGKTILFSELINEIEKSF